jgi:hypothetical protein
MATCATCGQVILFGGVKVGTTIAGLCPNKFNGSRFRTTNRAAKSRIVKRPSERFNRYEKSTIAKLIAFNAACSATHTTSCRVC